MNSRRVCGAVPSPWLLWHSLVLVLIVVQPAVRGSSIATNTVGGGFAHSCVILDTGKPQCWGGNYRGELGTGDAFAYGGAQFSRPMLTLPAVDIGGATVKSLAASSEHHVCALLTDASVRCWGGNAAGQLGLEDTQDRGKTPNSMGSALPAIDLGADDSALEVCVGLLHSCALLVDRTIKCW